MIPEGDTAFSTRNFGEGVAQQAKIDGDGRNGYGNEITSNDKYSNKWSSRI